MILSDFLKTTLLTEANVYNVKQPINGVSVDGFVKQCVTDITDPTILPQLIKKLSLLLVNDESNLRPITNLPDDAPDWAKTAVTAGELFVFVPKPALQDEISNIAHYVQAAIEDTKSPDNNVAIRAKQELSAIPKAPDLPTLYAKANEYFAAGEKRKRFDTDGMSEVQEYNGWVWYILESPEAFVREGNVLQNCIGKIWTYEKAKREGMDIYVLRTKSNDSVVAIRTVSDGNLIQEIKGKNNQPPVEKYMPYVFSFVKDSVLDLSGREAKNELQRAGYWVFNNKIIVPLSKAVEMYWDTETQTLRKIESGETIDINGQSFVKYTNRDAVKHIAEMFSSGSHTTKQVYKTIITDKTVLFYVDSANELLRPTINGNNYLLNSEAELKSIISTTICNLSSKERLKLSTEIQHDYNLSSAPPHTPISDLMTFSKLVEGFDKIDVSKLNGYDHWMAMQLFVKGGHGPKASMLYGGRLEYEKKLKKGINFARAKYMYRSYQQLRVEFTLWVDDKNTIFCMDSPYKPTSAAVERVRKLMATENLTIEKSANTESGIVIVPPSQVMTKQEYLTHKMTGNKTANTKTLIEFEDGASFKLLEGKPLTDWLEQAGSNLQTDAVYTLMIDNKPVVAIPVAKKKITGMFAVDTRPNTWRDEQLAAKGQVAQPTEKTLDFRYGKYIKAFAKKLGFTVESKNLLIKPDSKMEDMLRFIVNNPGQIRSKALRAAHVGTASAPGADAPYNKLDRPMIQLGLITSSPSTTRRGSVVFNPTEKGKEVARRLRNGENVPMFELVTQTAQIRGGNEPEATVEPVAAPRPQREPRVAPAQAPAGANRAGSKAQQIYALYSQMTADNNGVQPTRAAFIALIRQPPFNMTPAGASTYQYNVKSKYLQQHGQLGETFTFKEWLVAMFE